MEEVFDCNLLNEVGLELVWRKLLGLEPENAFECVGSVEETRLAFKLCHNAKVKGKAMDLFQKELLNTCDGKWEMNTRTHYGKIYYNEHFIPKYIFDRVHPILF